MPTVRELRDSKAQSEFTTEVAPIRKAPTDAIRVVLKAGGLSPCAGIFTLWRREKRQHKSCAFACHVRMMLRRPRLMRGQTKCLEAA